MALFTPRMAKLSSENAFAVGRDIRWVEESGRQVVKLNLGEPDYNSHDRINQVAIKQIKAGNFQ